MGVTGGEELFVKHCASCFISCSFRLNSFLDNVDVGDLIVRGDLEAFSCKLKYFVVL